MTRPAREQQLLDVAERTFAERGYSETTMEEIAARAGITKPVIYDHFGSKEQLLTAVVVRNRAELVALTRAALDDLGPDAPPEDHLRVGFTAYLTFFGDRPDSFRASQQRAAVLEVSAADELEELRRSQAELIADRVRLLPQLDALPRHLRLGIAEIVLAGNERVTAWWLRNPDVTLADAVELLMAVVWGGLRSLVEAQMNAPG